MLLVQIWFLTTTVLATLDIVEMESIVQVSTQSFHAEMVGLTNEDFF